MEVRTYLVLGRHQTTDRVRARRVTQHYPALSENEAVIALVLLIPDDAFEAPLFTAKVTKRQITVAIEAEEPEEATP